MLVRGLPDGIYGLDAFLNRALARLAAYPAPTRSISRTRIS